MLRQRGLGLVELMILMFLSGCIGLMLMRHYLSTKMYYNTMQLTLEQHIDVQLAVDLIRSSIRRAGFSPCMGIEHLLREDRRYHSKELTAIALGANSSLELAHMDENFVKILRIPAPNKLILGAKLNLVLGQAIMVADCEHAEVLNIKAIGSDTDGQVITLTNVLNFKYSNSAYAGAWIEESYFTKTHGGLFYKLSGTEELSSYIHNLEARMEIYAGHKLVHLRLGLEDNSHLELDTMIRTP